MRSGSAMWGPRQSVLLLCLAALLIAFASFSQPLRSPAILLDQSRYWAEMGLLAPFALMVIVAGGIDLSVGSILALTGVSLVRLHVEGGVPIAWAAAAGLAVGTLAGALNGVLIAFARIPDLVATLATMAIYRGLAQAAAQNRVYANLPAGYRFLGEGQVLGGLPVQWIVLLAAWAIALVLLHRTRFGRHAFALGSSPAAARFAGLPARGARVGLYALSGLAAAAAAILYTARANTAKSDDGLGLELEAVTCVVLGGAAVSGGRGSAPGVFLAVLVIGLLRTGFILMEVPQLWQRTATGAILVAMAALNERGAHRWGRRLFGRDRSADPAGSPPERSTAHGP